MHERREQLVLLGPERHRNAGPAHVARRRVHLQIGEAQRHRRSAQAVQLIDRGDRQLAEDGDEVLVRALAPERRRVGAHPGERGLEALLLERLEQVVQRARLECLEGVALVRGDEDDRREGPLLQPGRYIETGLLRHLDVEEHDVRPHPVYGGRRLRAFRALAHHLHVGVLRQQGAEARTRERLVVHDQRADRGRGHDATTSSRSGNERLQTAPPSGTDASSQRCSAP